jgi:hypothetical protein
LYLKSDGNVANFDKSIFIYLELHMLS